MLRVPLVLVVDYLDLVLIRFVVLGFLSELVLPEYDRFGNNFLFLFIGKVGTGLLFLLLRFDLNYVIGSLLDTLDLGLLANPLVLNHHLILKSNFVSFSLLGHNL